MKTSQNIWNEAKRSAQTYSHIKAAALVRIAELKGITFDEASKKCFIDGISIQNVTNITTNQSECFY